MKKRQCGIMLATRQKSHTFFTHFGWSQLATRLSPEFRSTCILVLGQKTTTKIFLFFQPQFYHTFSGSFLEHPFFRNCCLFCLNTIRAGYLACEQDFSLLNFLEFDIRIRIRSPSSLSTIQYYWWIAMSALRLRTAMCVPMYLFEHHLACDLVESFFKIFF